MSEYLQRLEKRRMRADELEPLLRLYRRVLHKVLRISKTFGIEGKKFLKPEDDYDALHDFDHAYDGTTTPVEAMHLELQRLFRDHPDLTAKLDALPGCVFSAKEHPFEDTRAVDCTGSTSARAVTSLKVWAGRSVPSHDGVGSRLRPDYIYRWLLDPQKIVPGTAMPNKGLW